MIPVPERYVPDTIRKRLWMRVALLTLSIGGVVLVGVWGTRRYMEELSSGPDLGFHRVAIARELMDSLASALDSYHALYQDYPHVNGKYFLDSIKTFVNISSVYVYADLFISKGETVPISKPLPGSFDYRNVNYTYVGVGRSERVMVYQRISSTDFVLYWVGNNEVDEHGSGDDIVYHKSKDP